MTHRRRLLRGVGGLLLAGTLAGCTGDETDGESGDDGGPTASPTPAGAGDGTTPEGGTATRSPGEGGTPTATEEPAPTPHELGSVHAHGSITVTVLGDRVDLSRKEYQLQDRYWHLEGGNGRVWHLHGKGVTLAYATRTLGIEVTESSVTYRGTTYEDGAEYDVEITVGGQDVDPSEYVLNGSSSTPEPTGTSTGSHVRIAVTEA